MSLPTRIAAACAALLLAAAVLAAAAATAVTAAATAPLTAIWHTVTGDPATADTLFTAGEYARIIALAEDQAPSIQAAKAISFASAQIGRPYIWGGTGPSGGSIGYDCSGLVEMAYRAAGVDIPRVATDQYRDGVKVELQNLQPGDLVYYGSPSFAHHVGMYLGTVRGSGVILDAAHPGTKIRLDPMAAGDLFAATRPVPAGQVTMQPSVGALPGAYPGADPSRHPGTSPATPGL